MKSNRILVITVTSWNSCVGANTWASLLENYKRENVANICIRDENPDSFICSRYFSISESKMIESLLNRKVKTGCEKKACNSDFATDDYVLMKHNERYRKMKKNRRYSMLVARELIWALGKWHTKELDDFIDDFNPDIILHSMEGYIHLNRIILHAIKRTGAKVVGYIWDDNFTYRQSSKIGYKFYRFFQRLSLKKLAKNTDAFFAISDMTKKEADEFFGVDCHVLTKPLNRIPVVDYSEIVKPIRMVYTGNLYIGRDKTLLKVVKAIQKFPKGLFNIDVYTQSYIPEELKCQIDENICHFYSAVPQTEVFEVQKRADVLLFLEDIDGPDSKMARLSLSTKTTDYLSSGRCIFAIGNKDTAPMNHFIENDAAITATNVNEIEEKLNEIIENPSLIVEMAKKSAVLGDEKHNKERIQKIFDTVIENVLS